MLIWSLLPLTAFLILCCCEMLFPRNVLLRAYSKSDWILNLSGFVMQGVVIPLVSYFAAVELLPLLFPAMQGVLKIGALGALLLNLVVVDFLYYLQHRAFHEIPWLWKFHAPHHYSPKVNIWCSSRNALLTHFFFVYLLVNPFLGYLCDAPACFFGGAMITAAMDLFRHANMSVDFPWLKQIIVTPKQHHRHHDSAHGFANYGANFILWDRIFGTADIDGDYPERYAPTTTPSMIQQLFFPWRL